MGTDGLTGNTKAARKCNRWQSVPNILYISKFKYRSSGDAANNVVLKN